ncbi:hypothetical protein BCR34DRAFT_653721 [Clohesyomyces aquaticus]|uniref:Glycoside hydrolase 131 catalytic N-terminal domain-containing protein n=1 Tax=Clohesyomyces aquaticus TaxID=1231657 RepID=A0A1Y1ZKY9_9PLEO|nr:hypothetical protein BCR34DRAFT_653721 [Clohesyomyces aquaticus]
MKLLTLFLLPLLSTPTQAYYIIYYYYTWASSGNSTSQQMAPYNAVFNGTLSVKMTASGKHSCELSTTVANYSMQIGAINPGGNKTLSRASYDTNPFYFQLTGPEASKAGKYGAHITLESSRDMSENATAKDSMLWSLQATKRGGGWDTTGNFILSSDFNYFALDTCEGSISTNIAPVNNWTVAGRIEEKSVNLTFGPAPWEEGGVSYTRWWNFVGEWNDRSAKLIVGGEKVETEGKTGNLTEVPANGTANAKPNGSASVKVQGLVWTLMGAVAVFVFF